MPAGGDYTIYAEAEGYQRGVGRVRGELSQNETNISVFLAPLANMPYSLTRLQSTPGGTERVTMDFVETAAATVPFAAGANCAIKCTPAAGYSFVEWRLDGKPLKSSARGKTN